MFELPALCVEPTSGFGSQVVSLLSELDLAETRSAVSDRLPFVLALAERNFDGRARLFHGAVSVENLRDSGSPGSESKE